MNILVMANFRAECSGNFLNSLLVLADCVKDIGWKTIFMFPLKDDGSQCDWVDYIRNSWGYEVILYEPNRAHDEMAQEVLNIIEEKNIDLIHSHFSCLHTSLLWSKEIQSKVKILFHDHMDYIAEEPVKPQLKKQIKTAKRYREYGIGVISVMKKKSRGYFLVPNSWYIANGLTYKRNVEKSLSREECRKALGLKKDEKLCLFLGWSIYGKGIDVAIKAILKLREKNTNIVLGIVGFGANLEDEYVIRIKEILGFDPRLEGIRFLDSWEDMFALHRAADVFLSASRIEAFSYALLEAISQNVPVVVSDINGTKWSWKYSKCIKFRNENVEQCVDAIEKAMKLRDEPSNSQFITKKYNIDIWCKRVIQVYVKMLKKETSKGRRLE